MFISHESSKLTLLVTVTRIGPHFIIDETMGWACCTSPCRKQLFAVTLINDGQGKPRPNQLYTVLLMIIVIYVIKRKYRESLIYKISLLELNDFELNVTGVKIVLLAKALQQLQLRHFILNELAYLLLFHNHTILIHHCFQKSYFSRFYCNED